MQTVLASQKMSFDYPAFDQATGLFVAGNVYDVSTGTPVFNSQVPMTNVGLGVYEGTFVPVGGKTYLVICAVYTDGTYATIDTDRSAVADEYFCISDTTSFDNLLFAFDYTAYDQDTGLFVQAKVWDVTPGSPVLVDSVAMSHVLAGCYFGSFTGTAGRTYVAEKAVYTDSGFTTPDDTRAPLGSSLQAYTFTAETPADNPRVRITASGRLTTKNNVSGRLAEDVLENGFSAEGRVAQSNNVAGRLSLFGA